MRLPEKEVQTRKKTVLILYLVIKRIYKINLNYGHCFQTSLLRIQLLHNIFLRKIFHTMWENTSITLNIIKII